MSSEGTPQRPLIEHGGLPPRNSSEPLPRGRRVMVAEPLRRDTMPTRPIRRAASSAGSLTLGRAFTNLMIPPKPLGKRPSNIQSLKAAIMASWLNVLLVFIPLSWAMHFSKQNDIIIFVFSFVAIIPLANLLKFATEDLSIRVGETIAGFLKATIGNVVELIVAIVALTQCKLSVVQSSLVGSILSNILLVLGMCFFAGGIRFSEQGFLATATSVYSFLLTLSVIAVLIPAAFVLAIGSGKKGFTTGQEGAAVLKMSHGVAVVLVFFYASSLVFQLWSHAHLYDEHNEDAAGAKFQSTRYQQESPQDLETPQEEEIEYENPKMNVASNVILLAIVVVLVAVTAEWLVDSVGQITSTRNISQQWVGLILLPLIGNAAEHEEHISAITVSVQDKLTRSLSVAMGSSIQIALFVIPFITILAWIMGKPLTLLFDPFQSVALFLSVIAVNYSVQDAKSNWLKGLGLICLYFIIAVGFWFYPGEDIASTLLTCT
ncbi:Sodium/calcium exchanger protein-domain-containing protein [Gautieria morchelliformis]|nr:Sodium/calcium exchanger protein-domain-containing protein [Gautieria morchelliformis]